MAKNSLKCKQFRFGYVRDNYYRCGVAGKCREKTFLITGVAVAFLLAWLKPAQ